MLFHLIFYGALHGVDICAQPPHDLTFVHSCPETCVLVPLVSVAGAMDEGNRLTDRFGKTFLAMKWKAEARVSYVIPYRDWDVKILWEQITPRTHQSPRRSLFPDAFASSILNNKMPMTRPCQTSSQEGKILLAIEALKKAKSKALRKLRACTAFLSPLCGTD